MGDWSFYAILDAMLRAREPLATRTAPDDFSGDRSEIAGRHAAKAPLFLTEFGREVLAGRADHAASNTIDLWLGGTHITNASLWRRDTESHRLIPPG